MEEMKITKLANYLKETGYVNIKNRNLSLELKQKIYESYYEKKKGMSKNQFCSYLKPFWVSKTTIKEIIKVWDKHKPKSLSYDFWQNYERNNYKQRYKNTSRTKNIDKLTKEQENYLIQLRENEPNKWYKLFNNGLFIPENKEEFEKIFLEPWNFWTDFEVSKRLFYDVIEKNKLSHRITKTQKIWLLAQHKKDNTLETYVAQMHHIYAWYKALHKWQLDIKYLTDIPNYVKLWLFDIYLYEITFRDYKSWLTICYYWDDRSKSSVLIALEMFKKLMISIWVNLKDIYFQFDWWAEFSNLRINNVKWVIIEMIEKEFWWYVLINKKEQNWHVESFHRRIEEDLLDTKYISNLKDKVKAWIIDKINLKKEILKLLNKYILNFNNYWYSSYKPRYELFWKKSPMKIIKEDWKEDIETNNFDIWILEKIAWAYDVTKAYNLTRISDYSSIIMANILLQQEKFDLAKNFITLISDNYLKEFYEFLDYNKSGRIWNETIDCKILNIINIFSKFSKLDYLDIN